MKFALENKTLDALELGQSAILEASSREALTQLYGLARRTRHTDKGKLFRVYSFTLVPTDMTQQIRYAARFERVA